MKELTQEEQDLVWNETKNINKLLTNHEIDEATNKLICLLDKIKGCLYPAILNHLLRQVGLFPYMQLENMLWEDKVVCNLFTVPVSNDDEKVLHRDQSLLLKKLLSKENLIVSAPTSFGKSFIIDSLIAIKKPNNVVIIVPTIALMDETRRRLQRKYGEEYNIITASNVPLLEKNILIFPQERALHYANTITDIDILIVDEFYKISGKFDKERSDSLMLSIIKFKHAKQFYFLAPNIKNIDFKDFEKLIPKIQFEQIKSQTVFLDIKDFSKECSNDEDAKKNKLLELLKQLKQSKTLIYAGTYSAINNLREILNKENLYNPSELIIQFTSWLEENYSPNWNLIELVQKRIGIHNGRQHRPLSQIQLALFEEKAGLQTIISTTSIIEGINTSTRNLIVWKNKNGNSNLNYFSYKNLLGRCGRMFKYFVGNVYLLDKPIKQEEITLELPFTDNVKTQCSTDELNELGFKNNEVVLNYDKEMISLLGKQNYQQIKKDNLLQSNNKDFILEITKCIVNDLDTWGGSLRGLLGKKELWNSALFKVFKLLKPEWKKNWDMQHGNVVSIIQILSENWSKTIPQILDNIKSENIDIDIDTLFKLERHITFKLTTVLNDINVIYGCKATLKVDISHFIMKVSHAFLPKNVYLLEEYGLPRMISKKISESKLIDFNQDISINQFIKQIKIIGYDRIISTVDNIDEFDKYFIKYFFDGI